MQYTCRSRIIHHVRVEIEDSCPLLLDHSIHHPAVKDAVKVVFIQVPEAIMSFVVNLFHKDHEFVSVVVHL